MPSPFRLDVPPHIASIIRDLHPDLKRSVRAAIDEITANPECGAPLQGELKGYRKYRVRRYRIVYAIQRKKRRIRLLAIAHRQDVYEDAAARLKKR